MAVTADQVRELVARFPDTVEGAEELADLLEEAYKLRAP